MNKAEKAAVTWSGGDLYQGYMGRWSAPLAGLFLDWLKPDPGKSWADVGCGNGSLSAAILEKASPEKLLAIEPSETFRSATQKRLGERAEVLEGSAEALPLKDQTLDYLVAGLVLNFVPDPEAALAEAGRVLKPGGWAAAYVWDYAGEMQMLKRFWTAAKTVAGGKLPEGVGEDFPLCNPVSLEQLFRGEGLESVSVTQLDLPMYFKDFEDYWQPFTRGGFPAPAYLQSLAQDDQDALKRELASLCPLEADGSLKMIGRAWAVRGSV